MCKTTLIEITIEITSKRELTRDELQTHVDAFARKHTKHDTLYIDEIDYECVMIDDVSHDYTIYTSFAEEM
jgi:hypothetical protein